MKYVSTRGNAPALGFCDVLLAGLASDGGLYVPEAWPKLAPATMARFAGLPYPEVAFEVLSPFVDGEIDESTLRQMCADAYQGFRHRAIAPLAQLGPNQWALELFHGPTLAFKDIAMQLLARLMDHVLSRRGERLTIIGATSGDTGGAAVEAFRDRRCADLFILFPEGRVSPIQQRQMTTAGAGNVHAIAIKGTFDDCQAIVKGMFGNRVFRESLPHQSASTRSTSPGSSRRSSTTSSRRRLSVRRRRKVAFTVPTGNFGDIYAGHAARQMGLPIERLVIATNVNDILSRTLETGRYELRGVVPTGSPSMDIQISSNFERLLFEAYGRDAAAVRRLMTDLAERGGFSIAAGPLAAIRAEFAAGSADEATTAATIGRVYRDDRLSRRSAHRRRAGSRRAPFRRRPDGHARHRPSGEISGDRRGRFRPVSGPSGGFCRSSGTPGDVHRAPRRSLGGRGFRHGPHPGDRRQGLRKRMSVRVTRLDSGLQVVTHEMNHLQSAALGIWIGAGSRSEREEEHGLSHLLEHMAFKGTKTRSATDIAEEIEAVGGEVNAATSVETTSYYARILKEDVPLALDILSDILRNSVFDAEELAREQHVILQEIGAALDAPEDRVYDIFAETAYPEQPIGRNILGTAETVKAAASPMLGAYLNRHYRGPGMVIAAAGALDHDDLVAQASRHFADLQAEAGPAPTTARYGGGDRREDRDLMETQIMLGFEGVPYSSKDFYTAQLLASIIGGGMSSRLFQEVREKRGLCYSIYAFHWSFADTGMFGVHAATGPEDVGRADAGHHRRTRAGDRRHRREGTEAGASPVARRPPDDARKPGGTGRPACPAASPFRPDHPARGTRRQDRADRCARDPRPRRQDSSAAARRRWRQSARSMA